MFDHKIELCYQMAQRDEYNEGSKQLHTFGIAYAQVTEHGGRENMYASRIVHENEVVYTIRYRSGVAAGQFVKDGFKVRKIVSVHTERRRIMHLTTVKTDAGECYDDA